MDCVLSTLYHSNGPVYLSKALLAANALCCWHGGSGLEAGTACTCHKVRGNWLTIDYAAERRERMALGALNVAYTPQGALVTTSRLTALFFQERMVVGAYDPCAHCERFGAAAHAIHCLGKSPACLNLSRCACVRGGG